MIDPLDSRKQQFDSLDLMLGDIKKVETDRGLLKLKLAKEGNHAGSDIFAFVHPH